METENAGWSAVRMTDFRGLKRKWAALFKECFVA